jgi:hypothetical protein
MELGLVLEDEGRREVKRKGIDCRERENETEWSGEREGSVSGEEEQSGDREKREKKKKRNFEREHGETPTEMIVTMSVD